MAQLDYVNINDIGLIDPNYNPYPSSKRTPLFAFPTKKQWTLKTNPNDPYTFDRTRIGTIGMPLPSEKDYSSRYVSDYSVLDKTTAKDKPTADVPTFADKNYDRALKNIALQDKYNTAKTVMDYLMGSSAYLANRRRKAPDMVPPARTSIPAYTSPYSLEKGLVDNSLATSIGSINKVAREMGTPEYINNNLGTILDSQLKAYLGIGADVSKVDNLQREAIATGLTADATNEYNAKVAYDTALAASNLQSSQTEAAQLTANSGILDQFIKNKSAINNSKDLQAIYKAYLNREIDSMTFAQYINSYYGKDILEVPEVSTTKNQ